MFAAGWLFLAATAVMVTAEPAADETDKDEGLPCIYEGQIKTDQDWFGFLLNITIMTTGRMSYELSYPAEKCCQNMLFYKEEQMSIMKTHMNCWQKEALVFTEEHQILRLTPTFPWSGCHLAHPNGIPTYSCEGGRSFVSTSGSQKPTSWYVGISSCHSLLGIELKYRILVTGHTGECKKQYIKPTPPPNVEPSRIAEIPPGNKAYVKDTVCVIEGTLNSSKPWYGFITNVSLLRGGSFKFRFSYPSSMSVQTILMYNQQDVTKLHANQSCWQKKGVISARNVPEQVMDLSSCSSWNGCLTKNLTAGQTLICQSSRRFELPRKIYFAVSNCRSTNGVYLDYRLEFTKYAGNVCNKGSRGIQPLDMRFLLQIVLLVLVFPPHL